MNERTSDTLVTMTFAETLTMMPSIVGLLAADAPVAATPGFPPFSTVFTGPNLVALLTLTTMEVVLGIDNIVFIAILAGKLPENQREKARVVGLALALITRVLLLLAITWVMALATKPLFPLPFPGDAGASNPDSLNMVSGKDIILLLGGAFLIFKATLEMHHAVAHDVKVTDAKPASFAKTIGLILVVDLVFSIDSVVTAVGMAQNLWVMVTAVLISVGVMLAFSGFITRFINQNPTLKVLALAFLLLIGVMLVAEGAGQHIPKGYIYFAMAFSVGVEAFNMVIRRKSAAKITPAPM
jgi:predicted tellurium resistance membrane protein TerC